MTTASEQVMLTIIQNNLLHAQCAKDSGHPCLVIWSSGAAEQIDAVISRMASPALSREQAGAIAYEAYRKSINTTTDSALPDWSGADHETQLAFRDAGEAVSKAKGTP